MYMYTYVIICVIIKIRGLGVLMPTLFSETFNNSTTLYIAHRYLAVRLHNVCL